MSLPPLLIAPAIRGANLADLRYEIIRLEQSGADWIHIDVMDGRFVPTITFGPRVVEAILPNTKLPLDVHLMVENPDYFIDSFGEAGASRITVHYEACRNLTKTLKKIKEWRIPAGVSLKPGTPLEMLEPLAREVDLIHLMCLHAGWEGQRFFPEILPKVYAARDLIMRQKRYIDLQVEGNIDPESALACVRAGANVIVGDSHIFTSRDYAQAIRSLRVHRRHLAARLKTPPKAGF